MGEGVWEADPRQTYLEELLNACVDKVLRVRAPEMEPPDDVEVFSNSRPIAIVGPPGAGKIAVVKRCVERAIGLQANVLVAAPTGQLASRMRDTFGASVDIDTCHGAFLLHRPETEVTAVMHAYDIVFVDEFPQLSVEQFDRVHRMWCATGRGTLLICAVFLPIAQRQRNQCKMQHIFAAHAGLRINEIMAQWRRCPSEEAARDSGACTIQKAIAPHTPQPQSLVEPTTRQLIWTFKYCFVDILGFWS